MCLHEILHSKTHWVLPSCLYHTVTISTKFYILLSRVSERIETRMTIDNLAKVFGPTMVGYSVTTPQPMQMIAETRPQQDVMTSLLEHNTEYWTDILSGNHSEVGSLDYDMAETPEPSRQRPGKQRSTKD